MADKAIKTTQACIQCGKDFLPSKAGNTLCSKVCKVRRWRQLNPAKVQDQRRKEQIKRRVYNHPPTPDRCKCGSLKMATHRKCGQCVKVDAVAEYRRMMEARPYYPKQCPECDCTFMVQSEERKFCTRSCAKRHLKRKFKGIDRARRHNVTVIPFNPFDVFNRDGWKCYLCGTKTLRQYRGTSHDRAPELDHIIALSAGGEHSMRNTACSCRKCNVAKADKPQGQMRLFG